MASSARTRGTGRIELATNCPLICTIEQELIGGNLEQGDKAKGRMVDDCRLNCKPIHSIHVHQLAHNRKPARRIELVGRKRVAPHGVGLHGRKTRLHPAARRETGREERPTRRREKRQACFSATPYILFHVLLVAPVVLPPCIFGGPWYRLSKESGWCSFLNRRALRPMAARDDPINVVEPKKRGGKKAKKMAAAAASAGAVLLLRAAAAETPDPYCQVRLLSLVQSPFSQACSGSNRPLKTSASEPSSARRF